MALYIAVVQHADGSLTTCANTWDGAYASSYDEKKFFQKDLARAHSTGGGTDTPPTLEEFTVIASLHSETMTSILRPSGDIAKLIQLAFDLGRRFPK